MTRLGIVGSRILTVGERQQVDRAFRAILSCYDADETVLHHGNQNGVEEIVLQIAKHKKIRTYGHNAKGNKGLNLWKERCLAIIRNCDHLYVVRSPLKPLQDSAWAYLEAERAGVAVEWIDLVKERRNGR